MRRAERTPGRLAYAAGERRVAYGELAPSAAALAGRLLDAGADGRSPIALWAPNGEAFIVGLAAILHLGAAVVPLNTRLTDDEAAWQLADARPSVLCAAAPLLERGRALAAASGCAFVALDAATLAPAAGGPAAALVEPAATAAVVYTSGTSGKPKGALLSHANLWHSAMAQAQTLGALPDDRWLACLPLFHVSGLAMLTRAWLFGQAVVVHERFDAERIAQAVESERITCVSLVPTALARLCEVRAGRPLGPSLRLVLLGGGPAPAALLRQSLALGLPVAVTYGLTETASQAATLAPAELESHLGSVGKPLMPLELRIERQDGGAAAPGEVGEIVVRGPTVARGYLGRPDTDAATLKDGWLHTGDVGHLDGDGYLYVADRRDDLIVSGGENVYPAEVEAVLAEHPQVAEAAVVGLPDPVWGQAVAAAVVPRPGPAPTLEALRAHCAPRLAGYKLPRRLRLVPELPRTASGKLRRAAVRADWAADGGRTETGGGGDG